MAARVDPRDVRDTLRAAGLRARHALSQNFLADIEVLEGLEVMEPESMRPVERDGRTIGEVMMRGHDVMKGYLKNKDATEAAFWSAVRTTLVGSITPAATRSS